MGRRAAQRACRKPWDTHPEFVLSADWSPSRRHGSTPYKIIQTSRLIAILYEENTVFRQIFLDGRPLPNDPDPTWMGYSVGHWEGDTLVVDSKGFREGGWLDRMGHPHSSDLHLIERFRRPDLGHLEVGVTVDDPKAYTKLITYTQRQTLIPDEDLHEYFCTENEKDREHFKK